MDEILRSGAFMEVIDVLGYDQHIAFPFLFQLYESKVPGIRFYRRVQKAAAAHIVELMDEGRIAGEGLRRGNILDFMAAPETSSPPERFQPAFGGNPGARKDDDRGIWGDRIYSFHFSEISIYSGRYKILIFIIEHWAAASYCGFVVFSW
jgi:hypothetical protein